VRAFAAERLAGGAAAAARTTHARWICDLAQAAAADVRAGGAGGPLYQLLAYRADLLAAVRATVDAGEIELAGAITAALGWCTHWVRDGELLKLARDVARDPRLPGTSVAALAGASGALYAAELGDLDEAHRLSTRALAIASAPEEQCLALLALGVVCVYRGEHAESMRHCHRLLELPGLSAPLRVDAHATVALIACFQSDQAAARQHAERAVSAARDAGPVGAFATYTMGEVRLREDPAAAVEILKLAVSQAEAGHTVQIAEVARVALVSALVRLGRHDEALRVFPNLLHQLRRRGGWPQLWTSLRILAELLAELDRPQDAALLLASASTDPSAPPVTGDDIPRYRELQRRITGQIGPNAHQQLADQAALLPRVQVLDRALGALTAAAHR